MRHRHLVPLGLALLPLLAACAAEPVPADPVTGPWAAARDRGVDLRAVGQEPSWSLELDDDGDAVLTFVDREPVTVPGAPPAPGAGDATTVYRLAGGDHTVDLTVRETRCIDTMSGEPFPLTVELVLDGGETLRGCGRRLLTFEPTG